MVSHSRLVVAVGFLVRRGYGTSICSVGSPLSLRVAQLAREVADLRALHGLGGPDCARPWWGAGSELYFRRMSSSRWGHGGYCYTTTAILLTGLRAADPSRKTDLGRGGCVRLGMHPRCSGTSRGRSSMPVYMRMRRWMKLGWAASISGNARRRATTFRVSALTSMPTASS